MRVQGFRKEIGSLTDRGLQIGRTINTAIIHFRADIANLFLYIPRPPPHTKETSTILDIDERKARNIFFERGGDMREDDRVKYRINPSVGLVSCLTELVYTGLISTSTQRFLCLQTGLCTV